VDPALMARWRTHNKRRRRAEIGWGPWIPLVNHFGGKIGVHYRLLQPGRDTLSVVKGIARPDWWWGGGLNELRRPAGGAQFLAIGTAMHAAMLGAPDFDWDAFDVWWETKVMGRAGSEDEA
jgi:hypothetical protein